MPKSEYRQKRLGAKRVKTLERLEVQGDKLVGEDATLYRALSARANYLALDRPDLSFSTKELCRDFSEPTVHSVQKLKRLIRYVTWSPRLVWHVDFQDAIGHIRCFVDTDFAGCLKTRRSTSGDASCAAVIFYSTGHKLRPPSRFPPGRPSCQSSAKVLARCSACRLWPKTWA